MTAPSPSEILLRPVDFGDAEILLEWINDPETRAASFTRGRVPRETHVAWLQTRLGESRADFFLASTPAGSPVGLIRFEPAGDDRAIVSVAIAPSARGMGLAAALIVAGCRTYFDAHPDRVVVQAYIRPENARSLRAFARAGFGPAVADQWNGELCARMDLRRSLPQLHRQE